MQLDRLSIIVAIATHPNMLNINTPIVIQHQSFIEVFNELDQFKDGLK